MGTIKKLASLEWKKTNQREERRLVYGKEDQSWGRRKIIHYEEFGGKLFITLGLQRPLSVSSRMHHKLVFKVR